MKKRLHQLGILAAIVIGLTGLAAGLSPKTDKYFEMIKNLEIFTDLYMELNTNYVDELDPGRLMRTGIDAMVGSLDPYTNYISESDIEGYRFQVEGKYRGIGAEMEKIGDYLVITELYKDQPADQAGLKPGDRILAVDGQDAKGRSREQLEDILRGFPGTTARIQIQRPGESSPSTLTLTRGDVQVPNVPYYAEIEGDVGYVNLTTFTQDAAANVRRAIAELKAENPDLKGIVLDLRWNGGGLLREAVDIVGIFVERGQPVVSTRGNVKEWSKAYQTTVQPLDTEMPVAVLINKRSASASEIVSGALQDLDRAVIIGQRSYGKGLVQNVMDLDYNSKVKITTAKYYIPSQRCIQSVEYENGEPVDIPDERRAKFKTQAGRTVLDGGGIAPDIRLDALTDEGIVKAIVEEEYLLFDYVTEWTLDHPAIDSVESFRFTEFDDFEAYLAQRDFSYVSPAERELRAALEEAKAEGLDVEAEFAALQARIDAIQADELRKHEKELIDMIEKEIAGRYFYKVGTVRMGLRNDAEVAEAVRILNDPAAYQRILSPQ
jgi:carboxyl-terminal processing protease